MNRKTSIVNGNFSTVGNFSGYDAQGERIFVHKRQMQALKWEKDAEVQFPFYAIVGERTITPRERDAEGKAIANTTAAPVQRLQALSIFKTQAELVAAVNADAKLNIAIVQDLQTTASSAGLSEAAITALLEAAI